MQAEETENLENEAAFDRQGRDFGTMAQAEGDAIAKQGRQGPGLFGVPGPEIPPGLFGPDNAQTDAEQEEGASNSAQAVDMCLGLQGFPLREKQTVNGKEEGDGQQTVSEDVGDV